MSITVSPLAPKTFPDLPPIAGVRLSTYACGIRYQGRTDLLVAEFSPSTVAAGVFTRSLTASAPVLWCRKALEKGNGARVLLVNSGNSNAFTGAAGEASVTRTVEAAATLFECRKSQVYVASTGTIGVPLDDSKITSILPETRRTLKDDIWMEAAKAIMTTDTYPKVATRRSRIGQTEVIINGIVKGSGMIAPDMATMLGYIFTDATLPAETLQALLTKGCDKTFNCITVDSDTSTSDTVMMFATGHAQNPEISAGHKDPLLATFRADLESLLQDLAHQVVRDGEGASKFVTVRVTGADTKDAARRIGLAIANSPLVKTAIAGEDANWGRIVMAVGKAGEKADRDRLSIRIGGIQVALNGQVVPEYDETPVNTHMKGTDILLEIDVGIADGKATVWTCDLTHGYIDINGSYRT